MAQVKVLFFAALAEAAGQREAMIDIDDGEPVGNLSTRLADRFPRLSGIAANVAFAVNAEYVPAGQLLKDGDEVALIPPVSGG
jgi:molybdopterin synthase catalytic subunit